ncbi:class I SAM-dependent methyltransferase [Novosphingobium sp. TH158]|uniref:class I SAM-dependent methyltransferase n=1 Tax=Novosphingobium sp. TH158 TaxID=2067455 RepID=UPI000C7C1320|nr:SAM-dependent methyltransferase [Novosphingobium sp. TH158]
MRRLAALSLAICGLAACSPQGAEQPKFPKPDRPVSDTGATEFSTEVKRDELGEAKAVMDLAKIGQGNTVADIGAGEGYYTVRLAERVGAKGRVLAVDIDQGAIQRLGQRVERERLDNVSIKQGLPEDPRLPQNSFDRVFMVHMYHEVQDPYAFLWHMRSGLRQGGQVIVVDVDRPTDKHGIPPALLFCEMGAVGFRLVQFVRKPELTGYYAQFEATGPRPEPAAIKPCKLGADGTAVQR